MAESVKITGNLADGTPINLSLDGASTYRQMSRLIKLVAEMTDKITKGKSDLAKQELQIKEQIANTSDLNAELSDAIKNQQGINKESLTFEDALSNLKSMSYSLRGGFGNLLSSTKVFGGALAGLGIGLVQNLFDYSDKIGEGLKRGVAGDVMDFAIAAKTAGVDMTTFTKALDESGGGFAMLGNGATEGAKNFATLVGEVRQATASMGNLGMTNAENAMFAAQQLKVAVAQGYKGRQAQDVVIKNSKTLGKEFDDLAARTGKSVMEMSQSAMKLAQDPLVASFIKSAGMAGSKISGEVQKMAANYRALFGEAGDKIASDLTKTSLGGLPFAITQSGKNMLTASSAVYSEMDRQAQLIKNGGELTEADRERLRNIILDEVDTRGDQLRTMSLLDGAAGDGARAILEMAKEARTYNDADRVEARKREQTAKDFNAAVRDMQANLMALSIPFLKLINGINWTLFIDVLNGFTTVLGILLKPLVMFGEILSDTGLGSVIGGLLALATAGSVLVAGFGALATAVTALTAVIRGSTALLGASKVAPEGFVGPLLQEKSTRTNGGTTRSPLHKSSYNFGRQIGEFVSKFSTELKFATLALAGFGIKSAGAAMLQNDAESTMGKTLEFLGTVAEILGTWIPIIAWVAKEVPWFGTALATAGAALSKWGGALITWVAKEFPMFMNAIRALTLATAIQNGVLMDSIKQIFAPGGLLTKIGPWISRAGAFLVTSAEGVMASLFGAGGALTKIGPWIARAGAGFLVGAEGILAGAGAILAGISAPVWGTVAAVAALGTGIYFFWDEIKEAGSWISNGIKNLWDSVTGMFTGLGGWLSDWWSNLWGGTRSSSTSSNSSMTNLVNPSTNISGDITTAQATAIDQKAAKDSENQRQMAKQTNLLEDLVASNSAQISIQSRTASLQDDSNKYLRTASLASA